MPARAGIPGDSVEEVPVAALAERVGEFDVSMDPWYVRLVMSKHSGSMWTVYCASSSTSPSCGQSHGPIALSIPLRTAPLLLGGFFFFFFYCISRTSDQALSVIEGF